MPVPVARTALRAANQAARPARTSLAVARSYASSSNSPPASTTTSSPAASTSAAAASTSASSAVGPSPLPPSGAARPSVAPQPTNLPGSNLPSPSSASRYSPLTVSIVTKLAKLFGYHSQTSTAIRTTSDYYDRCAERGEIEAPFFYEGASSGTMGSTVRKLTYSRAQNARCRLRSRPGSP